MTGQSLSRAKDTRSGRASSTQVKQISVACRWPSAKVLPAEQLNQHFQACRDWRTERRGVSDCVASDAKAEWRAGKCHWIVKISIRPAFPSSLSIVGRLNRFCAVCARAKSDSFFCVAALSRLDCLSNGNRALLLSPACRVELPVRLNNGSSHTNLGPPGVWCQH